MIVHWRDGRRTYFEGIEVYQYDRDCIELLDKKGNTQYIIPIQAILYVKTDPKFTGML